MSDYGVPVSQPSAPHESTMMVDVECCLVRVYEQTQFSYAKIGAMSNAGLGASEGTWLMADDDL